MPGETRESCELTFFNEVKSRRYESDAKILLGNIRNSTIRQNEKLKRELRWQKKKMRNKHVYNKFKLFI